MTLYARETTVSAERSKADIEASEGYRKLIADVERDEKQSPGSHNYRATLAWIIERAKHYAEKTGLPAANILNSWEKSRTYWYMNFYQESHQPKIEGAGVRVFETMEELQAAIGKGGFRCPACDGVSKNPYECDSGVVGKTVRNGGPCDWKVFGLLGDFGKGVYVFVKNEMRGERIFKPLAWEGDRG